MISNISSAPAATYVQPPPALYKAAAASSGATSYGDTVQLSAETQQYLAANAKSGSSTPTQPSFAQVIKEAADGDISALAKLALIA